MRSFADRQADWQASRIRLMEEVPASLRGEVERMLRHAHPSDVFKEIAPPKEHAGKDIKLLLSKDKPTPLGYWFWNKRNGHERYSLCELVYDLEYPVSDINNLPTVFLE